MVQGACICAYAQYEHYQSVLNPFEPVPFVQHRQIKYFLHITKPSPLTTAIIYTGQRPNKNYDHNNYARTLKPLPVIQSNVNILNTNQPRNTSQLVLPLIGNKAGRTAVVAGGDGGDAAEFAGPVRHRPNWQMNPREKRYQTIPFIASLPQP